MQHTFGIIHNKCLRNGLLVPGEASPFSREETCRKRAGDNPCDERERGLRIPLPAGIQCRTADRCLSLQLARKFVMQDAMPGPLRKAHDPDGADPFESSR
jgi:hypothetical protein